jgi:hypothetical protein
LLILRFGLDAHAAAPGSEGEFWPEFSAYINLNSTSRIFLLSSFRDNQPVDAWHGDFGAHLNFALKPVFRRERRQRDDVFNKRFVSFQTGFQYISSLGSGTPYLEHRWIIDCTPRHLLPWNAIGQLVYTPYINSEVFYDTRYGAWSQNRYSAGVQVPASAHIVLETYFLRQNQSYSTSLHVNVIGIKFLFYF